MITDNGRGRLVFSIFNHLFLSLSALLCLLPFINMLAVSLSGSTAVAAGDVTFWPLNFTLKSYEYIIQSKAFLLALLVTMERVALGVSLNMFLTILTAYPLSKEKNAFRCAGAPTRGSS
jgi:putative aldouronate transport system permease protein